MVDNGGAPPRSARMASAGAAAGTRGTRDPGETVVTCPGERHWLEIRLVGEDGKGLADTRCTVKAPDGTSHRVKTDANGVIRLEGLPKGKCQISFADLDKEAWRPA